MIEITNTGAEPVRVAGQYLQPGESLSVAEDVAIRLMAANPAVVVAGSEPSNTGTGDDGANAGEANPTEDKLNEANPTEDKLNEGEPAVTDAPTVEEPPATDATKRKK